MPTRTKDIFLGILAYHLLVAIEKTLRDNGYYKSWQSIGEVLKIHQVVTVVLPTVSGEVLRIRRATKPEPEHIEIYNLLSMNPEITKPVKS